MRRAGSVEATGPVRPLTVDIYDSSASPVKS